MAFALGITLTAAIAVASSRATAQTAAMTFTSAPTSAGSFIMGWQFTVNAGASINVSALGFFDNNNDGLVQAHTVGIYNSVGTLLTSGVVPTGTSGTLFNGYRYTSISPLLLAAGLSYTIASTNSTNSETWAYGGPGLTGFATNFITVPLNSAVDFSNGGAILAFPTNKPNPPTGYRFYGGPNFQIGSTIPSGVPEPGSVAMLLGTATTGLLVTLRRRKK
jgi:hypothetical protein